MGVLVAAIPLGMVSLVILAAAIAAGNVQLAIAGGVGAVASAWLIGFSLRRRP